MELLLSSPMVPPSAQAPHTLETIPGSAAPTPPAQSLRSSPTHGHPSGDNHFGDSSAQCEAGPSRRTPILSRRPSLVSPPPNIPGSYFSLGFTAQPAYSPSPSPATTPWERDRPRPPLLDIPVGTPEDPIFSNYPSTAPSRSSSFKGKQRAQLLPLASAFQLHLGEPVRVRRKHRRRASGDEDDSSESSPNPPEHNHWWQRQTKNRRRAATISHTPPETPSPASPASPSRVLQTDLLSKFAAHRRRASVGATPFGLDFVGQPDIPLWPSYDESKRIPANTDIPYPYPQPASAISRSPSSPNITPRRSSLASGITIQGYSQSSLALNALHMSPTQPLLGLTNLESPIQVLIPEDDNIPHDPPPRRSSLSFGPDVVIDIKAISPISIPDLNSPGTHYGTSVLSASLSTTEESGSANFFSPTSSELHPLSSATTSLSRSAKSGKDGASGAEAAKDASLNALKLQRSLDWEAKQAKHRHKLEKRRMILLELVETEVAYAEDLKALVEVYLPQLHALPSVPERTAVAVGRNAAELLAIHSALSVKMVEVLKSEGLGYEMVPEEDLSGKVERVSRRLASALVDQASSFSAYNEFCAGSVISSTLVRNISLRTDYVAFERRCQIISMSNPAIRLQDLLDESNPNPITTNKNRLHFRDYLIMPIQRVCRYPLLLAALLGAADTPSPSTEDSSYPFTRDSDGDGDEGEGFDVGVDVERALGAMRGVAEEADEARRRKESELKSATILARLEPHQVLTPTFIRSLGPCRLIGSLDVLHHHPTLAPLVPPVKVKYLAAFLYRGYLVLAKVKKGKMYEAKHFLPLEVFELIDMAEGFLPHSIRLSLREHSFDLAASCEAEKEVWSAALIAARDESTVPPFELPASVSPFAARSRRMSTAGPSLDMTSISPTPPTPNKRHTLSSLPRETPTEILPEPSFTPDTEFDSLKTPTSPTFSGTILLRRAAPNQRLTVDRGLVDIFSESCAQARSRAQIHHALFLPDTTRNSLEIRDRLVVGESAMLRRRRSFLDASRQHRRTTSNVDIAFSGEVRGNVIPIRPSKSYAGTSRASSVVGQQTSPGGTRTRQSSFTGSIRGTEESATEMDGADDTATSDFGTLRGGYGMKMRGNLTASPSILPLVSTRGTFRPGLEPINSAVAVPQSNPVSSPISPMVNTTYISSAAPTRFASLRKTVRKSASVVNLYQRAAVHDHRTMSTPSSPLLRAQGAEKDGAVKRSSSDPDHPPLPHRHKSLGPAARSEGWKWLGGDEDKELPPLPPPKERPIFVSVRDDDVGEHGEMVKEDDGSLGLSSPSIRAADISRSASTSSQRPLPPSVDTALSPPTVPVYSLGNGLTNTPDRASPWGSLRRTLTSRSQRNSMISLDDIGASPTSSPVPSSSRQRTHSAQPSYSRSTSYGAEQTVVEGLGLDDSAEREKRGKALVVGEGGGEDEASGAVMLPRRRRSVRLLAGLRSLTAK